MKIKVKKVHIWQFGTLPYLELEMSDGDFSETVLQLDGRNRMNKKLATALKKFLEENIELL